MLFLGLAAPGAFLPFCYTFDALLKNFTFPFDALRPRRAPTFWPAESRQRLAKEGCAPFGICGRARVACGTTGEGRNGVPAACADRWTPLWKPSLARYPDWPNSSPLARLELRCRWGKRERLRARHGRRTSTASGWGLRPLAPQGSPKGTLASHARTRMGPRPKRLCGNASANRKLLPRKRLGVPSLPSRELRPQAAPARPPAGESQRGRSPLWPVFAYFLLTRK